MKIASWNVNSIRARMDHVTSWLKQHQPDVLLMQELKATEFPSLVFQGLGYESVAVTQKAYNGAKESAQDCQTKQQSTTRARHGTTPPQRSIDRLP